MNYRSPIEVIQTQFQTRIEGEIYKAVMNVGVYVDKDELLKALSYDRDQYHKGYSDRDAELVRCKDCKRFSYHANVVPFCKHIKNFVDADWFCADGERKK